MNASAQWAPDDSAVLLLYSKLTGELPTFNRPPGFQVRPWPEPERYDGCLYVDVQAAVVCMWLGRLCTYICTSMYGCMVWGPVSSWSKCCSGMRRDCMQLEASCQIFHLSHAHGAGMRFHLLIPAACLAEAAWTACLPDGPLPHVHQSIIKLPDRCCTCWTRPPRPPSSSRRPSPACSAPSPGTASALSFPGSPGRTPSSSTGTCTTARPERCVFEST